MSSVYGHFLHRESSQQPLQHLTALSALFPWPRLSPRVYHPYTHAQGSGTFLNLQLTAIVAELLIFNFNTVIFNISHHAALLPHPSITPTFCLDLSDIFLLGANSHFVAENEMSLLPLESVTLLGSRFCSCLLFDLLFKCYCLFFFLSIWQRANRIKKENLPKE